MVFASIFSLLLLVLLISSIFFIVLSLILLRIIKSRNKKGKATKKCFPVILRIILILNIITLMIAVGVEISVLTHKDNGQIADEHLTQVIEAIENHDKEALRAMFSKQAFNEAEDLDGRIDYLFDFVKGDIESWESIVSGALDGSYNHGHIVEKVRSWYTVTTDKEKYLFFLLEYQEDTDHPENVGLYMLQVIKAEDRHTQFDGGQDTLCAGIYRPEEL